MRKISFIVPDSGIITAVCNDKSYTIPRDHPHYEELKKAIIKDDVASLERLGDLPKAIESFSEGKVDVLDGVVYYNGEAVHNCLSQRILRLMTEGFPFEPLVKFLENLMENPSKRSVDQLYNFLEHQGLPITEDGHFLAYKRVNENYYDNHSNSVYYGIKEIVTIDRNKVDDNPDSACSTGLHAGALKYVEGYGIGGHIVIVKINPRDCVSVPKDANCTKLRTCQLEVIGEYKGELNNALYSGDGEAVVPYAEPVDDWDWEDDDEFDDDYEDSWPEHYDGYGRPIK